MEFQAYMPHPPRRLKLLLIKPPKGWRYNKDSRETIRKLAADLRKILKGTPILNLPDGWNASVVEVDGLGVDLNK